FSCLDAATRKPWLCAFGRHFLRFPCRSACPLNLCPAETIATTARRRPARRPFLPPGLRPAALPTSPRPGDWLSSLSCEAASAGPPHSSRRTLIGLPNFWRREIQDANKKTNIVRQRLAKWQRFCPKQPSKTRNPSTVAERRRSPSTTGLCSKPP